MRPPEPVVLITGATGPGGRAAAARFAADGARLVLAGTDAGRLADVAARLGIAPDRWASALGDLRDPDGAQAVVAAATERFGRIDVLLHLVGGWTGGPPIVDLEPAVLRGMVDQHLWTTFNVVRLVVPGMVERGWGRIAAVSSPFAAAPGAGVGAYAVAKAAVEALLGTLAREVAATGVTVNLVVVRTIDTEHKREQEPSPRNAGHTTPEELADVLAYLASDGAASVNGARIPLFGRG
ncbi:MAG TPA: SDR family NAD(P)-dependent oxidoreductase [Candidatus Baltobacteraceae bacterium]|nr:SDR family NAD(P)-dependent oxidoreductase [Candidatus Baltobacteraceae bacterium]